MPRRCATPAGARSRDSEIFSDQAFPGAASENRTRDLRITSSTQTLECTVGESCLFPFPSTALAF